MEALLQIHSCFFSHSMKQRLLGGHAPPTFLEKVVIFRFERRYPQKYTVARLKSNISSSPNFLVPPKNLSWLRHSKCIAASPVKDGWGLQSHAEKHINYRKS